jgi:Resolvase, N terminal domain/Recombinase
MRGTRRCPSSVGHAGLGCGSSYQRISTDEERQPFSLDAQQERLAAYVAVQPGWVLTRSYSDRMSGKRLGRPGLQQALHDARASRKKLLLVFKVDRLARSTGGTPPFGHRYQPQRRILLPVPSEAALVQRIFTLYADRRLGSAAISGLVNDAGQPTARGRRWTPNRILGVLGNPHLHRAAPLQ